MSTLEVGGSARVRTVRCGTRALKTATYLKQHAADVVALRESDDGFGTGVPDDVLGQLHRLRPESPELSRHQALADFVRKNPVPGPGKGVSGGLFNGTLHLVQVTFHTPGQDFVIPSADMNTIVQYAQRAIIPIDQYASEYGTTHAAVSPNVINYAVSLSARKYTDANVKSWANDIATKNTLPSTDAVVIPSPQGLSASNVDANAGYHGFANLPYTIFGVFAHNLTMQDEQDTFAMVVSHEIAELIVDPRANDANPEVCDPCDLNCGAQNLNRAYFDAQNKYLGTVSALPPTFNFSYYICAVVKPAGASGCPAPGADCVYGPPNI
jgi:hypothetical protein